MHPTILSHRQRLTLIRREQTAARDLIGFYGEALARVRAELETVRDLIDEAQRSGGVSRRLAAREGRLQTFEQQARDHLAVFAHQAENRIRALQSDAVSQASGDAPDLMRSSLGPGARIEFRPPAPDVPFSVVGLSSDGHPLGQLLNEVAGATAAAARQELVVGVIRGQGPREIARKVAKASSLSRNRALLIARTEAIRAYRVTSLSAFRQNPSVVKSWTWQCTFDTRTCAACWAMSGTEHSMDESLNSHPGCRCSMLPRTVSWEDLGFSGIPDSRPVVERGVDRFAKLSASDQRAILGPGKYQAFKDGRITLPDLVQETRSRRWGPGRREASLRQALA